LPPATDHPATILIVDDEVDILHSLQILLETSMVGVRVLTADSGPKALEIIQREPVDILITDYRMPGMNGLELLVHAEDLRPEMAKMMITAFPKLELAIEAINSVHVNKFLVKPFQPQDFLEKVQSMLENPGR
jgi:response regulator RpfG family c-di-GMP phosphodiesterase